MEFLLQIFQPLPLIVCPSMPLAYLRKLQIKFLKLLKMFAEKVAKK